MSIILYTVMEQFCRLTGFIVTRSLTSWKCLRCPRFPNVTNKNSLLHSSSRSIVTDCRYVLRERQVGLQSQMYVSSYAGDNPDCDKTVTSDSSLNEAVQNAIESLDSLETETNQSELDVSGIAPALPKKSSSFAPYVNESEALSNLVKLGVNLSKIEERNMSLAQQIVKLDFEHDVKPILLFLHHCDVKECDIGECITRNPHLLCEPVDDMEVRVNYLESKKFSKESVAKIVSKAPGVLTTAAKETDAQLGYLQQDFMLSGTHHIRRCIILCVG